MTSLLDAKELATHLGSPASSDPPSHDAIDAPPASRNPSPTDSLNEVISAGAAAHSQGIPCTASMPVADEDGPDVVAPFVGVRHVDEEVFTAQALSLTVPTSVVSNVACNTTQAIVTWSTPTATSGCGGVTLSCDGTHLPTGLPWNQARVLGGGTFPTGVSEFCCHATDACAGDLQECWSVDVLNQTSMQVDVQLSPQISTALGAGFVRCIEFEVFQNCVERPVTFRSSVTFGGTFHFTGHFVDLVNIPSAVSAQCVTARDPQHTLRSCYTIQPGDCQANGILNAEFIGDPTFNGNWLIGGNLDGWRPTGQNCRGGTFDGQPCVSHFSCPGGTCEVTTLSSRDAIDILDFGALIGEWLAVYDSNDDGVRDGNAPCSDDMKNHADINGDGIVDLLDFSFLSMNFFKSSLNCCCPGSFAAREGDGKMSVSVDELRRAGLHDLVKADVNRDGVLDATDLRAFMQGGGR